MTATCECGRPFRSNGARSVHARSCTIEAARSEVFCRAVEAGESAADAIEAWRAAGRPPVTGVDRHGDAHRAMCTCGFVGLDDTEHAARLDADDHALLEHGVRQGAHAPRTPLPVRCEQCNRTVGEKQLEKFAGVDWALCSSCERRQHSALGLVCAMGEDDDPVENIAAGV